MKPEAKHPRNTQDTKIHLCPRHHDLTILLKRSKTPVCNTCFALLKKTHFSVIAGLLLEALYGRDLTTSHLERLNYLQKSITDHEEALLNLQAEITEIKKGDVNHEAPRPETAESLHRNLISSEKIHQALTDQKPSAAAHVPQARKELEQLPQARIDHFRAMRHKKTAETYPKTDDRQDRSTTIPHDNTKSTGQIIQDIQDKE